MTEFRAYRIDQDDGKVVADFATMNVDDLTEGDVVIKVSPPEAELFVNAGAQANDDGFSGFTERQVLAHRQPAVETEQVVHDEHDERAEGERVDASREHDDARDEKLSGTFDLACVFFTCLVCEA